MSGKERHSWQRFIEDDISPPRIEIPRDDSSSSFRIRPVRGSRNRSKPVSTSRAGPLEKELKSVRKNGGKTGTAKPKGSEAANDGKQQMKTALKRRKTSKSRLTMSPLNLEDPFGASDEIVHFLEDKTDCRTVMKYLRKIKRKEEVETMPFNGPARGINDKAALPRPSFITPGRCRSIQASESGAKPGVSDDDATPEVPHTDRTIPKKSATSRVSVEQETTEDTKVVKRVRFVDEKIGGLDQDSLKFKPRKPTVPKTPNTKTVRRRVVLYPSEAAQVRRQDQLRRVQMTVNYNDSVMGTVPTKYEADTKQPSARRAQVDDGKCMRSSTDHVPQRFQLTRRRYGERPNSADDDSQHSSTDEDESFAIHHRAQSFHSTSRARHCREAAERARQRAVITRQELDRANGRVDGVDYHTGHAAHQAWGKTLVRRKRQQQPSAEAERGNPREFYVLATRSNFGRSWHEGMTKSGCPKLECRTDYCSGTSESEEPTRQTVRTKPYRHHKKACLGQKSCEDESCSLDVSRDEETKETAVASSQPTEPPMGRSLTIPFIPLECDESYTVILKREKVVQEAGEAKDGEEPSPVADASKEKGKGSTTVTDPQQESSPVDVPPTQGKHPEPSGNTPDSSALSGVPSVASEMKNNTTTTTEDIMDSEVGQTNLSKGKEKQQKLRFVDILPPVSTITDDRTSLPDRQLKEGPREGVSKEIHTAPVTCWEEDRCMDLSDDTKAKAVTEIDAEGKIEHDDDVNVHDWLSNVGRKQTAKTQKQISENTFQETAIKLTINDGDKSRPVEIQQEKLTAKDEATVEPNEDLSNIPSEDSEPTSDEDSDDEFAFNLGLHVEAPNETPSPVKDEPVALIPPPTEPTIISDDDDVFDWFEGSTSPPKPSGGGLSTPSHGPVENNDLSVWKSASLVSPREQLRKEVPPSLQISAVEDDRISVECEVPVKAEEAQEFKEGDVSEQPETLVSFSGKRQSVLNVKNPTSPSERRGKDFLTNLAGTMLDTSPQYHSTNHLHIGEEMTSALDNREANTAVSQAQKVDAKNSKPDWLLSFSSAKSKENTSLERVDKDLSSEASKPSEPRFGIRRFQEGKLKVGVSSEREKQGESEYKSAKPRDAALAEQTTETQKEDDDILEWLLGNSSTSSKSLYTPPLKRDEAVSSQRSTSRHRPTTSLSTPRRETGNDGFLLSINDVKDRPTVGCRRGKIDQTAIEEDSFPEVQPESSTKATSRRRPSKPTQALDSFLTDNHETTSASQCTQVSSLKVSVAATRASSPASSPGNKVDKSSDWFDDLFGGSSSTRPEKNSSASGPSAATTGAYTNSDIDDVPAENSAKKPSFGRISALSDSIPSETTSSNTKPEVPTMKIKGDVSLWLNGGSRVKPRQERRQSPIADDHDSTTEKEQTPGGTIVSRDKSSRGNTSTGGKKAIPERESPPSTSRSTDMDWLFGETSPWPSNIPTFGRRSSRRTSNDTSS